MATNRELEKRILALEGKVGEISLALIQVGDEVAGMESALADHTTRIIKLESGVTPEPPPEQEPPPEPEPGPELSAAFVATVDGLNVALDASPSTGDIVGFSWDLDRFPDGTATGELVTVTYQHGGIRNVTLTVTDAAGQTKSTTQEVVIPDVGGEPAPEPEPPPETDPGTPGPDPLYPNVPPPPVFDPAKHVKLGQNGPRLVSYAKKANLDCNDDEIPIQGTADIGILQADATTRTVITRQQAKYPLGWFHTRVDDVNQNPVCQRGVGCKTQVWWRVPGGSPAGKMTFQIAHADNTANFNNESLGLPIAPKSIPGNPRLQFIFEGEAGSGDRLCMIQHMNYGEPGAADWRPIRWLGKDIVFYIQITRESAPGAKDGVLGVWVGEVIDGREVNVKPVVWVTKVPTMSQILTWVIEGHGVYNAGASVDQSLTDVSMLAYRATSDL